MTLGPRENVRAKENLRVARNLRDRLDRAETRLLSLDGGAAGEVGRARVQMEDVVGLLENAERILRRRGKVARKKPTQN